MVQTTNNIDNNTLYTLSIQVSLNGLSFCTANAEQEITALAYENFGVQLTPEQVLEKIKYVLDHNPDLKHDFSTIEVIYQSELYTFVPKALFDENHLKEYLNYNVRVLATDFIAYDELSQHEIITVYIPYTNINNFFFDTFGSFTYKHSATILLDSLLAQQKNNEQTTIFANINSKSLDLIVIKKGKFILGNTYPYDTKEDFLYYLMFVAEQLELNPEEFKLVFLGDIAKDSEFCKIAYTYIRNVDFGKRGKEIIVSKEVKSFEPHEHFVLLSHF
ncbi:DUF3822 family protein [Aquimarina sp. MMG016]|uniref:DUF3822 family protein n=1 Tax=Aquimarina sp. MMG016 TaxID=2822690 RepID=UPI001B3A7469|nr:DUF3822 family protein [Aquimarina sp. MMG016]MBQ4822486.1 DUF3822 family protein [Aquimarina sp. MMG016]